MLSLVSDVGANKERERKGKERKGNYYDIPPGSFAL
jgi:hypothetical protein